MIPQFQMFMALSIMAREHSSCRFSKSQYVAASQSRNTFLEFASLLCEYLGLSLQIWTGFGLVGLELDFIDQVENKRD